MHRYQVNLDQFAWAIWSVMHNSQGVSFLYEWFFGDTYLAVFISPARPTRRVLVKD